MKSIGKRFVALLVVFASIVSFLPIEFLNNGQAANADEIKTNIIPVVSGQDKKKIGVHLREYSSEDDSQGKKITDVSVDKDGNSIFTQKGGATVYGIAADDITLTEEQVLKLMQEEASKNTQAKPNEKNRYEMDVIVSEDIIVTSINQISASNLGGANIKVDEKTEKFEGSNTNWYYRKITNVPYGINRVIYKITVTKVKYIYENGVLTTEKTTDNYGNSVDKTTQEDARSSDTLLIYNGTEFVSSQVKKLVLDQYVGDMQGLKDENLNKNNSRPFLYESVADPVGGVPLKYEWGVPDSLTALQYNFTFDFDLIDTKDNPNATSVYVNGVKQDNFSIGVDEESGQKRVVSGSINQTNASSYFIVIKVNDGNFGGVNYIAKSYSIEISFPHKNAADDYSIKDAGITKYNYNDDTSVEAYVGKTFSHIIRTDGVSEYAGEITIDPKAYMISIDPELIRGKSSTAYVLTNKYSKNGDNDLTREAEIKDGKQFVEFNYGESNVLNLEVYEGANGSITGKLLAVYKFKVNLAGDGEGFETNLQFTNSYLTQLGMEDKEYIITPFMPNRTNYNLYLDDGASSFGVTLTTSTLEKNEYIRVFYSNSASGNSFTEIENGSTSAQKLINVNSNMKRIKIQAYYDQKNDDGTYTSSKLGREYMFYLAKNIKQEDAGDNTVDSNDASLSNIKIKGETLLDADGNKGFSSDKFDYEVKVDKETKTALLTVIPEDENVKSMVATVSETGASYDLYSGEQTEITLNEAGTTSLNIEVTAQDGKTSKNYTLTIINNTKGGSASLKNVVLSTGDYKFDPSEYNTKVLVDQSVNKIAITPIAEDSKAKVTVNGQKYVNSAISVSLTGSQKKEVEIVVTSEDGNSSKTYTLEIKRVTSGDDDNDNSYGSEDDSYYDHDNDLWIDNSKYDEWGTTSDGRVVYYDTKGRQVKDAWIQTNNKFYYLNKSGYRATGWKIDTDGKTYYLDPQTGEMKTGWIYVNGSTYYLNPRGIMQKGWLNMNGKWYYFTANGQMVQNTSMYIDERLYRFTQDGVMYY